MQKIKRISIFGLIGFLLIAISPSANAEKGYRYWGYFQAAAGATSWTAAMTGPTVELHDGDVEGWTFTASSNDIPATAPMADPDFASLCSGSSEVAGKIRVGIVIDFGTAAVAPTGETPKEVITDCVVVPAKSTGLTALQAIAKVRADESGLICGIAGYPASECGVEIDMPTNEAVTTAATTEDSESEESDESGLEGGFEVVEHYAIWVTLIIAIAIFIVVRKRKS